ncbi:response regulator [Actinoplanes solisilvae]|uniref:response regulator n=1 Tax=Actinoplanes solisilvae TaxID=2486853 RepID=UPI000FDCB2FC|nr:response regulator [Actinoplanes solisilvae]
MTMTVLYIEDSPINTMLVERVLRARPAVTFRSAPDGRTGLARADQQRPHLVLLDLELPDVSGERILADLRARNIPVIVVSGDTDPAVRRRTLANGARLFLLKPYEITDLLSAVDEYLGAEP